MFLAHHLRRLAPDCTYEVWGSDVDKESVALANNGVYLRNEIKEVPLLYIENHWARGTGDIAEYVKAKKTIKDHTKFFVANLLDFSKELNGQKFDVVFCNHVMEHVEDDFQAMREIYRVLKPGGSLLLAESTRAYIHSWIIRLLFRHPMQVQRSAPEFLAMLRAAGFELREDQISTPYLWWSRSDLGAREWFGLGVPTEREETLLNAVTLKPR
jgi:SAM-dependent methyltransferase